jgi:hypothetical protein
LAVVGSALGGGVALGFTAALFGSSAAGRPGVMRPMRAEA